MALEGAGDAVVAIIVGVIRAIAKTCAVVVGSPGFTFDAVHEEEVDLAGLAACEAVVADVGGGFKREKYQKDYNMHSIC